MAYFIKANYTERLDNMYDPEYCITDNYQNEVYTKGLDLVNQYGLTSVFDVGTGRAFKLLKYFSHLKTLGLDLPPTISEGDKALKIVYPDRDWTDIPIEGPAPKGYDLVICSDVIEHVTDPDILCNFIKDAAPRFAVISTPDRDLLKYRGCDDGPPFNECHVREWAWDEFRQYMDSHFNVLEHFYSNRGQLTQCVVVRF